MAQNKIALRKEINAQSRRSNTVYTSEIAPDHERLKQRRMKKKDLWTA